MVYLAQEMAVISTVYARIRDRGTTCAGQDYDVVITLDDVYRHIDNIQAESKYAIMDRFSRNTLKVYIEEHTDLFERNLAEGSVAGSFRVKVENLGMFDKCANDITQFAVKVCSKLMEILDPATNYPKAVFEALGLFEILRGSTTMRQDAVPARKVRESIGEQTVAATV